MKQTTRRYQKTASKAARDAADSARGYVTKSPWAALAIGALFTSALGKRFR